ncbi:MAG TPA: ABC transporter permease [Gemmatimonadaceae bacterium]|nr:ABC transporter permease [Gemmatimonadaceae bacterium]
MRIGLPHFARIIAQHRFFSACVIVSLGVGISSASGVIAIVDSMRYGPLPFRNADQVEHLFGESRLRIGVRNSDVPAIVFRALQAPGTPVEDVAAYAVQSFEVRDREHVFNAWGSRTTANFPQVLGARTALGRAFDSTDAAGMPAVMLSHRYWRSELGSDEGVVGRTIDLDGVAHRIVGVATREWDFPEGVTLWASSLDTRDLETRGRRLMVLAKLKEGADARRARQQIIGIANNAMASLPRRRPNERLSSTSFRGFSELRLAGVVFILTIISVFVGFLTAVNFAALVLARGIRRRGEVGVRAALGASVWRLARHIVAESLVLCALGGLVAALLGPSVVAFVRSGFAEMLPVWLTITTSWRSVAASAVLAMLLGMVFALGPALDIARPALAGFLRAASSTVADGAGLARTRSWVVGIQVALATGVLISLGAVMGRSLLSRTPRAGFDYQPLIVSYVSDSGRAADVAGRLNGLLSTTKETPGVGSAAYLDDRYLDPTTVVAAVGTSLTTAEEAGLDSPWLGRAGEEFFNVMRPRVAQGRLFTRDEESLGAPVAVVSRVVAHVLFDDAAIGKQIRVDDKPLTIVGVIEDIRLSGYQPDPTAAVFVPMPTRGVDIVGVSTRQMWVRVSGSIGLTARMVQSRGSAIGAGRLRIRAPHSMAASMAEELAGYRSVARLTLAIFGVALALAAIGIYGLVAHTAEMRSRELAIREALGATRIQVATLLLRGALLQALVGAAAGAMIAIIVVDYLSGSRFKLTTTGVASIVAIGVVVLTVLVSSIGPLRTTWRRGLSQTLRT